LSPARAMIRTYSVSAGPHTIKAILQRRSDRIDLKEKRA
jgi:hypothetical protein